MSLLKHNEKVYKEIQDTLQSGINNFCIVQGTGTGKSFLFMELAKNEFKDKRILYILPKFSIETNMRRYKEFDEISNFVDFKSYLFFNKEEKIETIFNSYDVIFVDEAHHLGADVSGTLLRKLLSMIKNDRHKYFIGLTATPIRADKIDVSKYFYKAIYGYSAFECIEHGLMKPIEYLVCQSEMNEEELSEYRKVLDIKGSKDLLKSIIRDNQKNKWICFFRTREDIAKNKKFIEQLLPGYRSIIISYEVVDSEEQLATIRDNEKVVIFCIDKILEGIHLPNADGVLLFRNVHSITVFQQILGRVMHVGSNVTPLIVDCTDTAHRMIMKLMMLNKNYIFSKGSILNINNESKKSILYVSLQNKKYFDIGIILAKLSKRIEFIYNGIIYKSFEHCCRAMSLNGPVCRTYAKRNNVSLYEAITKFVSYYEEKRIGFVFNGIRYNSFTHCCQELNVNKTYVFNKMKKEEIDAKKAIEEILKIRDDKRIGFVYNGIRYNDLKQCSKELNISYSSVRYYARHRKISIFESIEVCLNIKKDFIYNGKRYDTMHGCLKELGIPSTSIYHIIDEEKVDKQKAISLFLERKQEFVYKNKVYRSLYGCLLDLKILYRYNEIRNYAKRMNITIQESIDHSRIPKEFIFDSIKYKNITECCKAHNIRYSGISNYAKAHGVSKEEAMNAYVHGNIRRSKRGPYKKKG